MQRNRNDAPAADTARHKKKKPSSVSKSKTKSTHAHSYAECLLVEPDGDPHRAKYCTICGKINDVKFMETEKTDHSTYRALTGNETWERYRHLPTFPVNSIFDKYVVLSETMQPKIEEGAQNGKT